MTRRIIKLAVFIMLCILLGSSCSAQRKPLEQEQPAPSPVEQAQQNVDDAVEFFLDVLTIRLDQYWHVGDYDNAVKLLKLQADLDPQWIEPYDGAAWLLWSMSRLDEAEAILKKGIENIPDNYRLHFELGHMYFRTRPGSIYKLDEAEYKEMLVKSVDALYEAVKYPCPPDVDRLLGQALKKLERYDEAKTVLEAAKKKHPDDYLIQRDLERLEKLEK